ncbi:superoxide dismutase [Bacillus alkalicellulosilyticus]|uniref:superoxide dismutase n=1 Tax=Alkalihalobacterium alkalicellulosilyticum TaxID=1912214 RepID=UPI001FE42FCF|nr:superoxide dismutase [Bacillus alkalicellulosilyticus]
MEGYGQQLQAWVQQVNVLWDEQKAELEQRVGEEATREFELALVQLTEKVNSDDRGQVEEELFESAHTLYHKWQEMTEENRKEIKSMLGISGGKGPVTIGGHTLPPLPYDYAALEPYIEKEIMQLHHTKHHQSYVDGLNKAEKELQKARKTGNFDLVKHWERELAFHGAGHYLHTIFWNVMSPRGGGEPKGDIADYIKRDFGSFDQFKKHFSEAAKNVEAVGWAILVWAPRSHRLEILTAEKHQNLSQWDVIPLLPLDVWEHAYYLQYKNERAEYVKNWWNVVNWPHVNERFQQASRIMWTPY